MRPPPVIADGEGTNILYACQGPNGIPEHAHPELHIIMTSEFSRFNAEGKTRTGEKENQTLGSGDICIVPTQQPHSVEWKRDIEVAVFSFDPAFIQKAADEFTRYKSADIDGHYGLRDPMIQQFGQAARQEFAAGYLPGKLYVESISTVLAIHLLRRYSSARRTLSDASNPLPPHKLRRATDFIHENLHRNVSLFELAAEVGMSPYHFARIFKKTTGMSPHQYLLKVRIDAAKALIKRSGLNLVEISYRVGFQTQSHFTSVFRNLTGQTPKGFRDSL